MPRRDDPDRRPPPDRSFSARLARAVLVVGVALLLVRATAATVVTVRGNGMAPTIVDGEPILVLRGAVGVRQGDVVVYEPPALRIPLAPASDAGTGTAAPEPGAEPPDPKYAMRNTAVVDPEELERNWSKVRARSDGIAATIRPKALRVGRVLALPGQTVTFHVPDVPLGILIDGTPIVRKAADPLPLRLPAPGGGAVDRPPAPSAYEVVGERRYRILLEPGPPTPFSGFDLPPAEAGPAQITLDGYLVLADNRVEGACCDSRALGVIPREAIRGRVLARLLARSQATPSLAPGARGFAWMP